MADGTCPQCRRKSFPDQTRAESPSSIVVPENEAPPPVAGPLAPGPEADASLGAESTTGQREPIADAAESARFHLFTLVSDEGFLTESLPDDKKCMFLWRDLPLAERAQRRIPGHRLIPLGLDVLAAFLLQSKLAGVTHVCFEHGAEDSEWLCGMLPLPEAVKLFTEMRASEALGVDISTSIEEFATAKRQQDPIAQSPGSVSQESTAPQVPPADRQSDSDPKLAEVRSVTAMLQKLVRPYLPDGGREMRPMNRPHWIADAFRDQKLAQYAVAFLRVSEQPSVDQTTAVLELFGLPQGDLEELHNWLIAFRAIFVASYRERILQAAVYGADLSDPTVIDPAIGDLNPVQSWAYSMDRMTGLSHSEARSRATGQSKQQNQGCVVAFLAIGLVGLASCLTVVVLLASFLLACG